MTKTWLLIAILLGGCAHAGQSAPRPTRSPTAHPSGTTLVYYLVDVGDGLRLAREPHALPKHDAGDAVKAMIAGPEDPDYSSPWNPKTVVNSVKVDGSVVTVDLSSAARTAHVGSSGAALMIQQLVYTVTEVLGRHSTVRLLIDGKPAGELWGAVSWDRPIGRRDAHEVRQVVQLDTPAEGATVTSPVHVAGEAEAFESYMNWRVLKPNGQVVKSGHTNTAEGGMFSPYSFDLKLKPGPYTIEVIEDTPSTAHPLTRDTRRVTVRLP